MNVQHRVIVICILSPQQEHVLFWTCLGYIHCLEFLDIHLFQITKAMHIMICLLIGLVMLCSITCKLVRGVHVLQQLALAAIDFRLITSMQASTDCALHHVASSGLCLQKLA
jgi:hypothetical protein